MCELTLGDTYNYYMLLREMEKNIQARHNNYKPPKLNSISGKNKIYVVEFSSLPSQ